MFSRTGAAALKLDLNNTLSICEALGNPHKHFSTIHVAGTNGKGSVSHMIASILQSAGFKTGLYTSPHLYDFRERIKINGEMISQQNVIKCTEALKPLIESLEPSFFEVTVGMAFDYFAHENVDIAVIETGLGGRLDSTNIINPEISVITNIGLDHVQLLGDTLEKISAEKAGIIKPKVPVVIGRTQIETEKVFENAARTADSKIIFADQELKGSYKSFQKGYAIFEIFNTKNQTTDFFESDLSASYQAENIATVISSIHALDKAKFPISDEALKEGIRNTKKNTALLGRWDMIRESPYLFLDVGHNEDGIRKILEHIRHLKYARLHFILGMSKDKDVRSTLSFLPKSATYSFTQAHLPRAMQAEELKSIATALGLSGDTFEDVNDAINRSLLNATQNDLIIVCGSIFVVAEVNRTLFSQ